MSISDVQQYRYPEISFYTLHRHLTEVEIVHPQNNWTKFKKKSPSSYNTLNLISINILWKVLVVMHPGIVSKVFWMMFHLYMLPIAGILDTFMRITEPAVWWRYLATQISITMNWSWGTITLNIEYRKYWKTQIYIPSVIFF